MLTNAQVVRLRNSLRSFYRGPDFTIVRQLIRGESTADHPDFKAIKDATLKAIGEEIDSQITAMQDSPRRAS